MPNSRSRNHIVVAFSSRQILMIRELHERIPDVETLLVLSPAELGGQVLFALKATLKREGKERFHPANLWASDVRSGRFYSAQECEAVLHALSEAFAWLEAPC